MFLVEQIIRVVSKRSSQVNIRVPWYTVHVASGLLLMLMVLLRDGVLVTLLLSDDATASALDISLTCQRVLFDRLSVVATNLQPLSYLTVTALTLYVIIISSQQHLVR